jgi:sigma-B regulation protein RsbU (phosphoserine phosphatase)
MVETTIPENEIREEFDRTTERAHTIACWIGIALNLLWFASDYFVLPDHWIQFLVFRVAVSSISFIFLILKNKFKFSIYFCVFILVLGISVQNAYMWSVMDVVHLQQHAFAYIALFIGVGMLVLWEVRLSWVLLIVTIISNIVFYCLNSPLTVDEFLTHGGMLTLTVAIFCVFLIRTRYRLTYKEIRSRMELALSKKMIEKEHEIVVEQKKDILDSINYAKRIQNAMLASDNLFSKYLKDYFLLFKPKDIVSGDFYWAMNVKAGQNESGKELFLLATADSTGHGVPGAMMSMLNISCLNEAVVQKKLVDPAAILNYARERIISSLDVEGSDEGRSDGMDCSVIAFDLKNKKMKIAAANNPVWIIRKVSTDSGEVDDIIEIKPDKMPVGKHSKELVPFKETEFELKKGDMVYTLTDGYPDQFGGHLEKKFTYKKLRELLLSIQPLSSEQKQRELNDAFEKWKGKLHQIDDVLIIGTKID